jgi:hypothetical protein
MGWARSVSELKFGARESAAETLLAAMAAPAAVIPKNARLEIAVIGNSSSCTQATKWQR